MADLATKMLVHSIEPNLISMVDSFIELEFYIEGLKKILAGLQAAEDNLRMCSPGGILLRLKEPLSGTHTSLVGQIITGGTSQAQGVVTNATQDFSLGFEVWQLRLTKARGTFIEEEIATAANGTSGEVFLVIDDNLSRARAKAKATLDTAETKLQTVLGQIETLQTKVADLMESEKFFDTQSVSGCIQAADSGKAQLSKAVANFVKPE
jgi:hypothetical protein